MSTILLIIPIAFGISFVSGMLGLGGAIMLVPAFLYLPPLFGGEALSAGKVSGMVSLQVLAASLMSALVHGRKGVVSRELILAMGVPIVAASFAGSFLSGSIDDQMIVAVFAVMAIVGAVLIVIRRDKKGSMGNDEAEAGAITFNRPLAVLLAVIVGFFGGIAGAPGAFLLSPLMLTVLRIPTRVTIGSTLAIVLLAAAATSLGKVLGGMVPYDLTLVAIVSALPGAYLGSRMSHLLPTRTLRRALAVVIGAVGIQMWYQILK